ncbi:hypothetical protein HCJ76_44090 [Streptomyces sp. MC1]|uniref:hypothetical protein n=1 Tax=Streptomyces sp. MC1 TaxID=295105 RepID=UPI0018CA2239|nr:hypothetical protein [Streptomyces sp. MC1]MBG7704865.1 hypothetical protein [Streptomyces sp. MC1]
MSTLALPQTAGDRLREYLRVHGLPFTEDGASIIVPGDDGHHFIVTSRAGTIDHTAEQHTGWTVDLRHKNGGAVRNGRIYADGIPGPSWFCGRDSDTAARAIAFYISVRRPRAYGSLRPDYVHENCTGPNRHCKKAYRQGRPVHIRAEHFADGSILVLPTNHYATVEAARAAVAAARENAATITTDAELFRARRLRQPYRILPGWTDPTRR